MKYNLSILIIICSISSCVSLSYQETRTIRSLEHHGISVEKPAGDWQRPVSPVGAGALNLLPGVGNFYLASGNAAEENQFIYGLLNFLSWPFSVVWGVPQTAIDASAINKRELIYYYTFDEGGQEALQAQGLELLNNGRVVKTEKE